MDRANRFRQLALALPDATEGSHMGATDFRLKGRIFATLAYVARGQATLMLTPEQQQSFLTDLAEYTEPAPGGWGRMGMTLIRIDAPEDILTGALLTAYHHIQSKRDARKPSKSPPSSPGLKATKPKMKK